MLETFFNPKTVAVVGVSAEPTKLGAVVFNNILAAKFKGELYAINPRNAGELLYGKLCLGSVRDVPSELDLVVVVVPSKLAMAVIDDCVARRVKNVSIITAGFGEVGNHELEDAIGKKCLDSGINLLGPNCLGHIATHSALNASFADGFPKRGKIAFISQSGAYCSAMLDWAKKKKIGFSHFISIGNKALLSETELLQALAKNKKVSTFVLYLESLKNGQEFLKIAREIVKTKPILVLEPGKSSKAQAASLSHTGNLAPDYRILELALRDTGIVQAHSTRDLFGLIEILHYCKHSNFGGKIAVVTNAGGVGVLTSDLCEENGLDMAEPSSHTRERLKAVLPAEAALGNPIDVIGDARADRYENVLNILCESGEYENILVLLTPQMVTDPVGTAETVVRMAKKFSGVNIFTSFLGGERLRKAIKILETNHIVNFEYPVDLVTLLGLLKRRASTLAGNISSAGGRKAAKVPRDIEVAVGEALERGLSSLPTETVNRISEHYAIDCPRSGNFTDRAKALNFCRTIFPKPVVLKLSSTEVLHKTEMKGVFLNIGDEESFARAWSEIQNSIDKFRVAGASVLVQEMIGKSTEAIVGVTSNRTFGKILMFGSGGIYTEVMKDTSLRILPTTAFSQMIGETKVGEILRGVRGEPPKAVEKVVDLLEKIQQIVLDIPQLVAIDINPVLVTEDRALVVDFKIIVK
ncbi:MAG: acetate--CoA ligase family protein [Rickettsiales bacterium]|jgi:acetyltransferase|nr:acetate--CoA ligase family protein [Rickettsiales bacterium]